MTRTRDRVRAIALLSIAALVSERAGAAVPNALSAIVTNSNGSLVHGVVVVLTSSTRTYVGRSTTDGHVTIDRVPADTYRIVVGAPGYKVLARDGVALGDRVRIDVVLAPSQNAISGTASSVVSASLALHIHDDSTAADTTSPAPAGTKVQPRVWHDHDRPFTAATTAATASATEAPVTEPPAATPPAVAAPTPPLIRPPVLVPIPPPAPPAVTVFAPPLENAPPPRPENATSVVDSLLGLYNASHPVHSAGQPYYGRYSYVLLRDGDATAKAKNRAFVTKLFDSYQQGGTNVAFGSVTVTATPLSFNAFFFPVGDRVSSANVSAITVTAASILNAYDYGKARDLEIAYCTIATHVHRSLCHIPFGKGPLVLTFLRPLPARVTSATMPAAFAYDFSNISPDQFDGPLGIIQTTIAVPAGVLADKALPPPLAARIASTLDLLTLAIDSAFSGVHAVIDKQPGVSRGN